MHFIPDGRSPAFRDFAGLNKSGDIVLRHMVAWEGFDDETIIPGPFDKFILADIDDDRQMEVLAQERDIIRIFQKNTAFNFIGPSRSEIVQYRPLAHFICSKGG